MKSSLVNAAKSSELPVTLGDLKVGLAYQVDSVLLQLVCIFCYTCTRMHGDLGRDG